MHALRALTSSSNHYSSYPSLLSRILLRDRPLEDHRAFVQRLALHSPGRSREAGQKRPRQQNDSDSDDDRRYRPRSRVDRNEAHDAERHADSHHHVRPRR